ncbi:AurF N-oxygenase family protein [Pseudonocardia spinosispora]|uniref:AurF N-oxygenase family protein n=1 Tax=Pseudonocardia spinosispora TaxID=103441 RepID=UPI00040B4411|nr:diiron oxygenase [Pseudonocardia spinosispora]
MTSAVKRVRTVGDREATAVKLLDASLKHSFDPQVDVAWNEPWQEDTFFLPEELSTLYGTDLWQRMSRAHRIELSRCELANNLAFGIWVETLFVQMLARHALSWDPASNHLRYALTEIGDETRHSTMFSRTVEKLQRGPYRFNVADRFATDLLRAFSTEPLAFVAVLFVEEMFDALQRIGMRDETIQPLCRQTFRIHVVEEARHMRFARDELFRVIPTLSRAYREALAAAVAYGIGLVVRSTKTPEMYAEAGLDVAEAVRAARSNPHAHEVIQRSVDHFIPVYRELGLITPASRLIWRAQGLTV